MQYNINTINNLIFIFEIRDNNWIRYMVYNNLQVGI
jgi:hypothetical protein